MQNNKQSQGEMPFLDHVAELRKHLIRAIIGVVISMMLVGLFWPVIKEIVMAPLSSDFITFGIFNNIGESLGIGEIFDKDFDIPLKNLEFAGQFTNMIGVLIVAGIILSLPYIVYEFFQFLRPGLSATEKRYSNFIMFFTVLFFLLGVAFSYFLVVPLSVNFMYFFRPFDADNEWTIITYINTFVQTTFAMGVVFLMPIIVFFLAKIGLITPIFMKTYRRHAFVVILTIAAIITPADLMSMFIASIPLLLLYELSVVIVSYVYNADQKLATAERNLTKK